MLMEKRPCVYMLANKRNGSLYVGVTSDVIKRVWEHKSKVVQSFTGSYAVDRLVWYELHDTMELAIQREKNIKSWKRRWKLELIEQSNPYWKELYEELV